MADDQSREYGTRRQFLQSSAIATAALGTLAFPQTAHAGGSDTLRVGLVGCGGRGTAAAIDALSADPHTELVAIGDTAGAERYVTDLKLTAVQLKALAGELGISGPSKAVKAEVVRQIVQWTVGRRLTSETSSRPAPAQF